MGYTMYILRISKPNLKLGSASSGSLGNVISFHASDLPGVFVVEQRPAATFCVPCGTNAKGDHERMEYSHVLRNVVRYAKRTAWCQTPSGIEPTNFSAKNVVVVI